MSNQTGSISPYYCVGWVSSAHGIRGEIFLRLYTAQPNWLSDIDSFNFIKLTEAAKESHPKNYKWTEISDSFIEAHLNLQILEVCAHKNGYRLKLKGYSNRTQAESLRGYLVRVPTEIVSVAEPTESDFYFHQIIGFKLLGPNSEDWGTLVEFYDNGAQEVLVFKGQDRKFDIPFVEGWLIELDFEKQVIKMDFPVELMEL